MSRASAAVFVRIAYLRTFLNPDFLCKLTASSNVKQPVLTKYHHRGYTRHRYMVNNRNGARNQCRELLDTQTSRQSTWMERRQLCSIRIRAQWRKQSKYRPFTQLTHATPSTSAPGQPHLHPIRPIGRYIEHTREPCSSTAHNWRS